jgi:hypothetical protein
MTQYLENGFTLTDKQLKQIANASKKGVGVKLKLGHAQLVGDHKLLVTKTQQNHIAKNYNAGVGVLLDLSAKQLRKTVSGGILPLIPIIGAILAGLGTAGGIATGVTQAVHSKAAQDAAQRELERHHRELEAQESQALKAPQVPAQALAAQGAGLVTSAGAKNTGKGKRKSRSKAVAGEQQGGCEASMPEASHVPAKQCPTCKGTGLYLGKK